MSVMKTLLWKEWRDHRALLLVLSTVLVVLILAAEELYGPEFDAVLRTTRVLPAMWLLFLVVLSADVATRDHVSGAGEALGRLPMPTRLVWIPRLLLVTAAAVGMAAIFCGLELLVRRMEGTPGPVDGGLPWIVAFAGMILALGVMGAGGLLRRSLPAALVGLAIPLGVPLAVLLLPSSTLSDWLLIALGATGTGPERIALFLALALLSGALLGYTPWARRDRSSVLLSLGGLALVLVPCGVVLTRSALAEVDLIPHDERIWIGRADPSPDGRWVALEVHRNLHTLRTPYLRDKRRSLNRSEVWLLDRESRAVKEISNAARALYTPAYGGLDTTAWGDDGLLTTTSVAGPTLQQGGQWLEVIDPEQAQVTSRLPAAELKAFERERGLAPWFKLESALGGYRLTWIEKDVTFDWRGRIQPSPLPGQVFTVSEQGVRQHFLETGTARLLIELEEADRCHVSPDGRYLAVHVTEARQPGEPRATTRSDIYTVESGELVASSFKYIRWSLVPGQILWSSGRILREDGTWLDSFALPFDARYGASVYSEELVLHDLETGETLTLYEPQP